MYSYPARRSVLAHFQRSEQVQNEQHWMGRHGRLRGNLGGKFNLLFTGFDAYYKLCLIPTYQVPHHIQQAMSHDQLPRLGKSVPTFEFFMKAWKKMSNKEPRLQPFIKPGLAKAESYYNKMENSPAYVIAMCKSMPLSFKRRNLMYLFISHINSCWSICPDELDRQILGHWEQNGCSWHNPSPGMCIL